MIDTKPRRSIILVGSAGGRNQPEEIFQCLRRVPRQFAGFRAADLGVPRVAFIVSSDHVERFVRSKPAFFFNSGVNVVKEILCAG